MNWSGLGLGGWEIRFRELEHIVRRLLHSSREDPEHDLPDVELSDGEQQAALRREVARRTLVERG